MNSRQSDTNIPNHTYTFTSQYGHFDPISFTVCLIIGSVFAFNSVYSFFYPIEETMAQWGTIVIIFSVALATVCFYSVIKTLLDFNSSKKTASLIIRGKSVHFMVLTSRQVYTGFESKPAFSSTRIPQNVSLAKYWLHPKGWLTGKLGVTREMFHAVDENDQVEVEYYPYTKCVTKLKVFKFKSLEARSEAEMRQIEISKHRLQTFRGVILTLLGVCLGLMLWRYFT